MREKEMGRFGRDVELTARRSSEYYRSMENGNNVERGSAEKNLGVKFNERIKSVDSRAAEHGLNTYMTLKPDVEKWGARDIARIKFMLGQTKGGEAVKDFFNKEEGFGDLKSEAGIVQADLDLRNHLLLSRPGLGKEEDEKRAADRAKLVNTELYEEWVGVKGRVGMSAGDEEKLGKFADEFKKIGEAKSDAGGGSGGSGDGNEVGGGDDGGRDDLLATAKKIEENTGMSRDIALQSLAELRNIRDEISNLTGVLVKDPTNKAILDQIAEASKRQADLTERLSGQERPQMVFPVSYELDKEMARIEYFEIRSGGKGFGEIEFLKKFDPDDPDLSLEGKDLNDREKEAIKADVERRNSFIRSLEAEYAELESRHIDTGIDIRQLAFEEQIRRFENVQKWVGVVMNNSEYGGGNGKLKGVSPEQFEILKKWRDKENFSLDAEDGNEVVKGIKELAGIGEEGLDFDIRKLFEGVEGSVHTEQSVLPTSLRETADLIQRTWPTEHWGPGEEHEIFNKKGEFQIKNFKFWIEKRLWQLTEESPKGELDPLNQIAIQTGYSNLSVVQILAVPQYTQHREMEIDGDVRSLEHVSAKWGPGKEHPEFNMDRKIDFIIETWQYGVIQSAWSKLNGLDAKNSRESYIQIMAGLVNNDDFFRSNYWLINARTPSLKGDEAKNYFEKGEQGSIGKARVTSLLAYRHLTDLTEFYMNRDNDGKAIGVNELNQQDGSRGNMFYGALEHDGSSYFLQGVAEGSLNRAAAFDVGADVSDPRLDDSRNAIKKCYRDFLLQMTEKMGEEYRREISRSSVGRIRERNDKLDHLLREMEEKLNKSPFKNFKIRFDGSGELEGLKAKIEQVVMGRRIVSDAEKGRNKEDDSLRSKCGIERDVRGLIRENLGEGFIEKLNNIQVKRDGGLERIGDQKVYLSRSGRIITESEYKELGDGQEVSLKRIISQFAESYKGDSEMLDKYEDTYDQSGHGVKAECEKILARNEAFAFGLLSGVTNIKRDRLNVFKSPRKDPEAEKILEESLIKSLKKVYGLNDIEATISRHYGWYLTAPYGIDAFNNTSGFASINQGTALVQTKRFLAAEQGLSTLAGSFLGETNALVAGTVLDRISVEEDKEGKYALNMLDVLQGNYKGEGGRHIAHRWERDLSEDTGRSYSVESEAGRYDVLYSLVNADKFLKLLVEQTDLHLHDIVKRNAWGAYQVDTEKLKKIMGTSWDVVRKTLNVSNINFDKKISFDGKEMTIREYMFGEKTRNTLDILEDYYMKKTQPDKLERMNFKKDDKRIRDAYRALAKEIQNKPALGVMVNMIATELHEHMDPNSQYEDWDLEVYYNIWWLMDEFLRKSGEYTSTGDIADSPPMVPLVLSENFMKEHGFDIDRYKFKSLFMSLLVGIATGLKQAVKELGDEVVQVEKIYRG